MDNKRATRQAEARSNEMRKQYSMEYIAPLDLPQGVAREGYMYCYANKDVPHQVESMMRQGWLIVPSDRAPKYALDPFKKYDNFSDFIWYKDAILMEIPEVLGHRLKAEIQSRADNAMMTLREHVSTDTAMYGGVMRGIHSF